MTNAWDVANRLTEIKNEELEIKNEYNGVNDRVGQVKDSVQTDFALDVATGLPEVIYTSEGNAYLHLPGVIMTESSSGEVRYLLSDGLGSVRQAVDETGEVVAYTDFDPYGNPVQGGGAPYGYTGEWWQEDVELLHLRARWYAPYLNQFISPDPIIPDYFHPQSLNQYSYALNNPVNRIDPTGLSSEPKIPTQPEWTRAGGLSWEYSNQAIDRLIHYRKDIVAAAQRHGFMPLPICTATPQQGEFLYTLAAIVYRESLGYDEEAAGLKGPLGGFMGSYGFSNPLTGEIPSVGIGQIRPNTALELEREGLVYIPRSLDQKWIYIESRKFEEDAFLDRLAGSPPFAGLINRLSNPVWAIEYVAANMEYARTRENYWGPPDPDPRNRLGKEWERMASYYNTGVVNINRVDPETRDAFWQEILEPYVFGTYKARLAIQGLDLLGVKSTCDGTCGQTLTDLIVTPD